MASQRTRQQPRTRTTLQTAPSFNANPQQAAAISHTNGPAAFIAAAGTGKTSILVQRLVRLVADEGVAQNLFSVSHLRALPLTRWRSVH